MLCCCGNAVQVNPTGVLCGCQLVLLRQSVLRCCATSSAGMLEGRWIQTGLTRTTSTHNGTRSAQQQQQQQIPLISSTSCSWSSLPAAATAAVSVLMMHHVKECSRPMFIVQKKCIIRTCPTSWCRVSFTAILFQFCIKSCATPHTTDHHLLGVRHTS